MRVIVVVQVVVQLAVDKSRHVCSAVAKGDIDVAIIGGHVPDELKDVLQVPYQSLLALHLLYAIKSMAGSYWYCYHDDFAPVGAANMTPMALSFACLACDVVCGKLCISGDVCSKVQQTACPTSPVCAPLLVRRYALTCMLDSGQSRRV